MTDPSAARTIALLLEFPPIEDWEVADARQFYFRLHVGDIPTGYRLVMDCSNDKCVNPGHICCVPDEFARGLN